MCNTYYYYTNYTLPCCMAAWGIFTLLLHVLQITNNVTTTHTILEEHRKITLQSSLINYTDPDNLRIYRIQFTYTNALKLTNHNFSRAPLVNHHIHCYTVHVYACMCALCQSAGVDPPPPLFHFASPIHIAEHAHTRIHKHLEMFLLLYKNNTRRRSIAPTYQPTNEHRSS